MGRGDDGGCVGPSDFLWRCSSEPIPLGSFPPSPLRPRDVMDFLDEENIAGQTLLRLASRGSAIIAELLRLSDNIPVVFLPMPSPEVEKYKEILFDFKYLKSSDAYEAKIDKDTVRLPFTFSCSFHFDGIVHVVCVLLCFACACCAHDN